MKYLISIPSSRSFLVTLITKCNWLSSGAFLLGISLILIICTSCQSSDSKIAEEEVENTVRQLTLDWIAAEASNDVNAALSFMWEDAVMQPPNASQIQGHEAIRNLYAPVTFVSIKSEQIMVKSSNNLAVAWGPLTVVLEGPTGQITDQAKFVAVWEQRNGKWKVLENSWSSNLPPPNSN